MSRGNRYPRLTVDLGKLRHNIYRIKEMCESCGVELAGVIKGFTGIYECVREFDNAGLSFIASSRLDQLEGLKARGIRTPLMMIRIPMMSEAADVVRYTDMSLNSEVEVLRELDREAGLQGRTHSVILMKDCGDLREGFWKDEELLEAALLVENDLPNLDLAGIGTNFCCYGAIAATVDKLEDLVAVTEMIEDRIGRRLRYISGGSTVTIPRIIDGNLPERINMLRIGEAIILAKDIQDILGYDMSFMHRDVFRLSAEIIEIKTKPTYPVGTISFDAFCHKPEYEDRGIRRRALAALGKADFGYLDGIAPERKGMEIVGASSDHLILDIEDLEGDLKVGDIVDLDMNYASIVYVTNSDNINIEFIE